MHLIRQEEEKEEDEERKEKPYARCNQSESPPYAIHWMFVFLCIHTPSKRIQAEAISSATAAASNTKVVITNLWSTYARKEILHQKIDVGGSTRIWCTRVR